jgi:SAM-dependent methyltransferase
MAIRDILFEAKLLSSRFGRRTRECELDSRQKEHLALVADKFDSGEYRTHARSCAWCGNCSFLRVSEYDLFGLPATGSICKSCGLFGINPRLDERSSEDFFRHHFSAMLYGSMSEDRKFNKSKKWCGTYLEKLITGQQLAERGDLILDVGCGSGGVVSALREAGYDACGIDIDQYAISQGQARGLPLWHRRNKDFSPVEQKKAQIVLYVFCLEYIEDLRNELSKVHDVITPGGYLIVMGHRLYRPIIPGRSLKLSLRFYLKHYFSKEVLKNMIQSVGFCAIPEQRSLKTILQKPRVFYTCIFQKSSKKYSPESARYKQIYTRLVAIELLCRLVFYARKFIKRTLLIKRVRHSE